MKKVTTTFVIALTTFLCATTASAQLKGDHLLGDMGINSGTQPPPSLIVSVPLYWYDASKLIDNNGNSIGNPNLKMFVTGVGATLTTNLKLLGANYGASLILCFANNVFDSNISSAKSPFNLSDTYLQPIQLGWHLSHADFIAGYALYLPTGRYSYGGSKNSGLGMWTNELSAGATVYFDKKRTFSASTTAFYEMHSKKEGSATRTGDIVTIEGGAGKTFNCPIKGSPMPMPITFGAVYYGQFKATGDRIAVANTTVAGKYDHVWAFGLQAGVLYPKTMTSLSFRWLAETGARSRFQGNTYMVTISQFIKMYHKK